MFVLTSDVTIGKFRFSGVNAVEIKRSIHSIAETATITVPSISRIVNNGKTLPGNSITGQQFRDGDPVTINLGYNGALQTEFRGFVKQRSMKMPLTIECEGYSWLLRRNSVSNFWQSISVKNLLEAAVSRIDSRYKISVRCDIDIELTNVAINQESGFDIIKKILAYTDGNVTCFFIKPDVLWCGLLYTPVAKGDNVLNMNRVKYRMGYNVIKDNSLTQHTTEHQPTEVKYSKKHGNGDKATEASDAFRNHARTHSKILNQIKHSGALKQLANEKAFQLNYSGYEGHISTFLQPYVEPGYEAYISDDRYPELDGSYLVESTEVHFGQSGARRVVEIGPKKGFTNE